MSAGKLLDGLGVDLDQVRAEFQAAGWTRLDRQGPERWVPPGKDRPELHLIDLADDLLIFAAHEGRGFGSVLAAIRARPRASPSVGARLNVSIGQLNIAMGRFAESTTEGTIEALDLACLDVYDILELVDLGPMGLALSEAILALSDQLESLKRWLGVRIPEELDLPMPPRAPIQEIQSASDKVGALLEELVDRALALEAERAFQQSVMGERGEA